MNKISYFYTLEQRRRWRSTRCIRKMGKGCFRRPPRRMGNYRLSVNDGCPRHIAHPAYPIYHLSRPSARLVLHREQAKLSRNGRALDTRSLGQKSHLPGDTWSQMPSGAVLGQLLLKKKSSYIQNGWRPHPEAQWLQQRWVQPSSRILTTSNQPNEVTLRVTESMEEPLSVLASHTKHVSKQRVTSSFSCIRQIFEDIKQAKHV